MSETNTKSSSIVTKILVIYFLGVLGAMTISIAVPALDGIAREFHPNNPALVGLVMSLPGLVVAVGALISGYLTDRFGDKLVMSIGAVLLALGDAAVSMANNMQVLLTGRLFSGIGYVLVNVAAITVLMRITSGKQRTWALAFWSTFPPASWIIPLAVAGPIEHFGWRFAFAGHGILLIAFLVVGLFLLPSSPKREASAGSAHTAGVLDVLKAPMVWLLGISFAADSFLHNGIMSTTPPFLHRMYGINPITVDHWNIGSMVINALGCLILGQLFARDVSSKAILIWATIITGVPAIGIYALPLGATASVAAVWVLMLGSGILTAMWAYAPVISPSPQCMGATSGMLTQLTLFGVLLSGPSWFVALAAPNSKLLVLAAAAAIVVCCVRAPIILRFRNPNAMQASQATPQGTKVADAVAH